jgi:hypothetical protein
MMNIYLEKYIINTLFDNLKEDYSPFQKYINESNNKYVISFPNLSGDTILIIPMPRKDKQFATIKDFIDNASLYQQKVFLEKSSI